MVDAARRIQRNVPGKCPSKSRRKGRKGWNEGYHLAEQTFDEGLAADIGYKFFNALCRLSKLIIIKILGILVES